MDKSLKFWVSMIAMCLAFLFTLVAGVSSQVRWVSLLQRSTASMVLFGTAAYVLGMWLESQIRSLLYIPEVEQQLDAVSEHPEKDREGFDPFTSESFERIHRK